MHASGLAAQAGHVALVLATIFAVAYLARAAARWLRQPAVIIELAMGLAAGPLIVAAGGSGLLTVLLPVAVTDWVELVGQVGLVLFLIGVANELHAVFDRAHLRAVGWSSAGGFLVPITAGAILAIWVLTSGDPALRGTAPAPALALLLTVSLSVTAVPVLARILAESGLANTRVGRLSMTVAVIIDAASWLLLAVAVGLAAEGSSGVGQSAAVLVASVLAVFGVRRALASDLALRCCGRFPNATVLVVVLAGLAAFVAMENWGLTGVFGAILVGFAIPNGGRGDAWQRVVELIVRGGRLLVPVFFVVTGITVFVNGFGPVPWLAIALVIGLAVGGKVAGGYLGARLGGESHRDGLRMGVLLNARGLTELVVLQAGYVAGILTPTMFLALIVMALVTTAMTRPAYALVERSARRGVESRNQFHEAGSAVTNSSLESTLITDPGMTAEIGSAQFRSLMSTFPTGVAIVTTTEPGGKPWGMTCSTVCSVAIDPPTLLVCLRERSPTLQAMLRLSTFAVNLLHVDARDTAELFASGAADRFDRVRWRHEPAFGGPHLIDAAHAVADCKITKTVRVGDHAVVFGEVLGVAQHQTEASNPLLYGFRHYSSWTDVRV